MFSPEEDAESAKEDVAYYKNQTLKGFENDSANAVLEDCTLIGGEINLTGFVSFIRCQFYGCWFMRIPASPINIYFDRCLMLQRVKRSNKGCFPHGLVVSGSGETVFPQASLPIPLNWALIESTWWPNKQASLPDKALSPLTGRSAKSLARRRTRRGVTAAVPLVISPPPPPPRVWQLYVCADCHAMAYSTTSPQFIAIPDHRYRDKDGRCPAWHPQWPLDIPPPGR